MAANSMTRRVGALLPAAALACLLLGPAQPASAAADAAWAWVTVRRGSAGSLIPHGVDSGSWNAGGAGVTRVGTGHYLVTFYGAHQNVSGPEIALASPIGSTARTCAVVGWDAPTTSVVVEVKCQTLSGTARDSHFGVHWIAATGTGGRLGYALNWSPTSDGATPAEAYNSNGGPVVVHPMNQTAQLRFGSQGVDGGIALVSATDRDRNIEGSFPTSCSLARLTTVLDPHTSSPDDDTLDKYADVKCWETSGASNIYHEHVVLFMKGLGLKGVNRHRVAYLWARRPTTRSYRPAAADRYSSSGGPITVTRLGTGRYSVTFAKMPRGGGAQVTAVSDGARRVCTVAGINATSSPARVKVSCFDGSGAPSDTRFTLAYTR